MAAGILKLCKYYEWGGLWRLQERRPKNVIIILVCSNNFFLVQCCQMWHFPTSKKMILIEVACPFTLLDSDNGSNWNFFQKLFKNKQYLSYSYMYTKIHRKKLIWQHWLATHMFSIFLFESLFFLSFFFEDFFFGILLIQNKFFLGSE